MPSRLFKMIDQRRNRKYVYSTQAYWNSKANAYNDNATSMWHNRALNRLYDVELKEQIGKHLQDIAGSDLLDLGCGTGRVSRWFAGQGARVTGLDFSSGSLEIARRQSAGGNPSYRLGSAFELDDENAFDAVFTWGVVTFACSDNGQLLDVLTRIRRALRPHGRLLLAEPVHRGFLHRVLDLDLSEFLSTMREAGFVVKSTAPLHFWPMRLLLCYISWPAWFTRPLYHIGQGVMKVPGFSKLADYWMIVAHPAQVHGDIGKRQHG
jgi:2-polyprenyl-3-methyl-5-hydroxy-6-metoxy-1,4-benzoquinol methylase